MAFVVLLAWTIAAAALLVVGIGYLFHRSVVPARPDAPKADAKIVRQLYRPDAVPDNLDAIVIGSGIGGLGCAAVLARLRRRVLVLEQHDIAGGCCHAFQEGGFEFDTGVHYVGDVHRKETMMRAISDFVSDGQLEWNRLGTVIDEANIAGDTYIFREGVKHYEEGLIEKFPEEAEAIRRYTEAVLQCVERSAPFWICKLLPKPLRTWVMARVEADFLPKYFDISTRDFLLKITKNEKLICVVTYLDGDAGLPPHLLPFAAHAFVVAHYINGAGYPVGGSGEIARSIIPVIERSGGKVLVRSRVEQILIEGNKAVGVRLQNGDEIRAPVVISDAGVYNTIEKMLPKEKIAEFGYAEKMKQITPGASCLSVFVGLRGSQEELNLPRHNLWVNTSYETQEVVDPWTSGPIPMFLTFPSAKDPEFNKRFPGKSTCILLTEAKYDWFAKYKHGTVKQRGEEYQRLKESLAAPLVETMYQFYPQTQGRVELIEVGTPLTNAFYLNAPRGEGLGLQASAKRFRQDWLRADQPIKNLYLTGQDVLAPGWVASLSSGLITALQLASWTETIALLLHIVGWNRSKGAFTSILGMGQTKP